MKKCPYCAEEISSNSKKCKHCGELLFKKTSNKISVLKLHSAIIKAVFFILASKDVFILISGLVFRDSATISQGVWTTLFDFFFLYYLIKRKNWARLWIIGRTILAMIVFTFSYFTEANYVGWIIDISILTCVLVLLFGRGSRKKAIIVTSIYSFLFIILIGLTVIGITSETQTKNIIQNTVLLKEQKSEAGFKIILPSNKWRFLKKEDSLSIIGEYAKNADIVVADINGKLYGVFMGEDLTNIQLDMDLLSENVKKEYFSNIEIINEYKDSGILFIESRFKEYGIDYIYTMAYRVFNKTGVTIFFWGELQTYNSLREDMLMLINNIQEISRKQFLSEVSSQDIYRKNSDAVVLVRSYDKKGNLLGYASGFNVLEDGLIITNLHTILNAYYMDVKFPYHGVYEQVYIAGVSKTLHDLVILRILGKNLPHVNLDDSMEIEIGDKIVVISNPEGLINSLSEGVISGLRDIEGYLYYQTTAPISAGSSGGAVFNQFANIIGISTAYLESGQNLNFCVPITEISNCEIFEQLITLQQFQELLRNQKNK